MLMSRDTERADYKYREGRGRVRESSVRKS